MTEEERKQKEMEENQKLIEMKESSLTRGLKSVGRWAASELMPTLPTSRSFQFGMNLGSAINPGDRWTEQKLRDLISRFQG